MIYLEQLFIKNIRFIHNISIKKNILVLFCFQNKNKVMFIYKRKVGLISNGSYFGMERPEYTRASTPCDFSGRDSDNTAPLPETGKLRFSLLASVIKANSTHFHIFFLSNVIHFVITIYYHI